MSWFKGNREIWKDIIDAVAAEEHRTRQMVEKDTIQSMILLALSKSESPFVFKGGTSLSKAFNLIDRFSEDIDLSLEHKPSESEKRKINRIIMTAAENMGLVLANPDDVQSRHSYNRYVFEYESLFSEMPLELIVETNFYQPVYPVELHTVKSFIGRFCEERNISLPIPFDAARIEMRVQSLERTFVDKVFAICDYRLQNMQDRDSRHLYDIAKLLPEVKLTPELASLIDRVRDDRRLSKNNPSAQPEHDIPDMLKEIIESRFYERDYNNVTMKLLYEKMTYDETIEKGIARIAPLDLFELR